jgi:dolichyl-phosphate beta-glucosyltransferase
MRAPPDTTLSIVFPIFNEERRLPELFQRLPTAGAAAADAGLELREILLMNDGSTDRSAELLREFDDLGGRVHVVSSAPNDGKGAAVRRGMLRASGDVALMCDVDLSTPLDDLSLLAAELRAGADMVIGSRALAGSDVIVHQPRHRERMGKGFNVLVRALTGVPWRDTQCGFKLFRLETTRRLFELQRVEGFAFDLELLVTARRLGLRVAEVPVRWTNHPETHVGLLTASTAMALDTVRIAYRARRPLPGSPPMS